MLPAEVEVGPVGAMLMLDVAFVDAIVRAVGLARLAEVVRNQLAEVAIVLGERGIDGVHLRHVTRAGEIEGRGQEVARVEPAGSGQEVGIARDRRARRWLHERPSVRRGRFQAAAHHAVEPLDRHRHGVEPDSHERRFHLGAETVLHACMRSQQQRLAGEQVGVLTRERLGNLRTQERHVAALAVVPIAGDGP